MRNDPFSPSTDKRDTIGLANVLTGYAALAIVVMFIVALLVAGHRHATAAKPTHAELADFGIEELTDLYATEPAATLPDLFTWSRPRPITRAELDPRYRQ